MNLKKYFIQKMVNPILYPILGSKRMSLYRKMKQNQFRSLKDNTKEQATKLYNLIRYCEKNIPYYQNIIKKHNISYSKDTIFEDIKKFPILTKDIIRKNHKLLINRNYKKKYYENTSGGSTGQPIRLLQDIDMRDYTAATKMLFNEWAGRKEGEYMIKLWGSEKEVLKGTQGFEGFFVKHLMNIELLNTFIMSEKDMHHYIEIINKKKPKIIGAYVQSTVELADFIEKNNIKVYSPKAIMCSAGTLFPEMKKKIEGVFKTKTFNVYGSREIGDMACECNKHKGLHINLFANYIEILDEQGKSLKKEGAKGRIIVTSLSNHIMPLIRYDIGDIATITNKTCSCGRGFPLLKTINGRTVNIFINAKNERIDGEYFTHLFYFEDWVDKFQVIQKKKNHIVLQVKAINKPSEKKIRAMEKKMDAVMHECSYEWKFVDEILPTTSGKFIYTISEVKK